MPSNEQVPDGRRRRVVVVGAGFAGYHAVRSLRRKVRDAAEIVLINPTDYFLYLPLLPEVATGVLDPRRISVSLTATLPGVRLVLGEVDGVDLDAGARRCSPAPGTRSACSSRRASPSPR